MLYGSGGCSLYDAAKLRALGGIDPAYDPAYVEDLDIGYRAWQRGWPTVYVAGAVLEHRHRATSSRYYTARATRRDPRDQLPEVPGAGRGHPGRVSQVMAAGVAIASASAADGKTLRAAPWIALSGGPKNPSDYSEELLLALGSGAVAVFPGQAAPANPHVLIASANVCRGQPGAVLVVLSERLEPPPSAVLAQSAEVVVVRRSGGSLAFRAAVQQTVQQVATRSGVPRRRRNGAIRRRLRSRPRRCPLASPVSVGNPPAHSHQPSARNFLRDFRREWVYGCLNEKIGRRDLDGGCRHGSGCTRPRAPESLRRAHLQRTGLPGGRPEAWLLLEREVGPHDLSQPVPLLLRCLPGIRNPGRNCHPRCGGCRLPARLLLRPSTARRGEGSARAAPATAPARQSRAPAPGAFSGILKSLEP